MEAIGNHSEAIVEIHGKSYLRLDSGKVSGYVSPTLTRLVREKLREPDLLLAGSINLKPGSRSVYCAKIEVDGKFFFLKRYNRRNFRHALKYSLRRSRPERNLRAVARLQALGVRVPEAYAALTVSGFLPYDHSFLLTEYLGESVAADKFIDRLHEGVGLARFFQSACRLLKTLHDAGVAHGDLKLSNIFIVNSDSDEMEIGLLDFDGSTIHPRPRSKQRRAHEIARLISSWLITCRTAGLDADPASVCKNFLSEYRRLTGIDIKKTTLDRHIRHFLRH